MVSQEVVRPSAIAELKADLIEAVTNAYMAKRVPELSGLRFDRGECKDGEFRYKSPSPDNVLGFSLEGDVGYYCSYPGGVWREDETFLPDGEKASGDSTYGTGQLFDAGATFAMIESEVSSWVDPWTQCHSPNEFGNQIASMANVAAQLYIGNEIVFGGQSVAPVGSDDSSSGASAVSDVRSAIDEVKLETDDMRGLAIDAFQRSYVVDIERTIGGQRGLATAAGLAITAEATAWNETYVSLRDFVRKAIHDFNDYAGAHAGGGGRAEATLGAVAAVSGLAGATVGLAFPPFGAAMGVVGGVATVGGLMFSGAPAVAPRPLALGGGDFMAYWTSFKGGIKDINADLKAAEDAIVDGCRRMLSDYHAYPDNYSITKGGRRKQGYGDATAPFVQSEIDFNHTKMRRIAGAVESIGDHQRGLAGRLGGVDGAGNPSSLVSSEWSRGSLPEVGVMGNGFSGPYDAYAQVVDELTDLLLLEASTAHRLAEHCIAVSLDFRATDDQRESALDNITRRFDTQAIPVVNQDR